MARNIVDFISEEDYPRYNELLNVAEQRQAEYKETHKTERAPRKPLTDEQKINRTKNNLDKLQAKLNKLLAEQGGAAD